MVRWHCQPNGHEFEQTPGVSEGQRSLVYCSSWGRKELDTTERLDNNDHHQAPQGVPMQGSPDSI